MADLKLNLPLPSKGLVVDRPGEFVDERSATAISNMEVNRSVIRKRAGSSALGSSLSSRIQRVFELQVGASTRLFRVGMTAVQAYNKATDAWASVASSALTGTESDMVSYAFPVVGGTKVAAFSNGIDAIRRVGVSGNDAVLGGSPPKAKFLLDFGPYLLLAYVIDGGTDYRTRVQWCDTGDPEEWATGNAGSADLLEDHQDITGIGVFGSFVTVHKAGSIYVGQLVTSSEVFRFERRSTGVGTCAHATIQNLPSGEQVFLASDGIHLFNGVTAPLVESPVQDELREGMNPAYLYKAQGVFVPDLDEYWVCVAMGSDTEPQTVYKYNWRTRQVYKDSRSGLTALGLFLNTDETTWDDMSGTWDAQTLRWDSSTSQNLSPLVVMGFSSGVTTRRNTSTNDDAGSAVSSNWDTKDFTAQDFGLKDLDRIMRWKGLELWAKGSGVTVYYSTNGGDSWTLADTKTLDSDYPGDDEPCNVYFDVVSSRIRFRFLNSTAAESFTLKQYQIEASPREARK